MLARLSTAALGSCEDSREDSPDTVLWVFAGTEALLAWPAGRRQELSQNALWSVVPRHGLIAIVVLGQQLDSLSLEVFFHLRQFCDSVWPASVT